MAERETAQLGRLRRRIDAIDLRIVALLNERSRIALAIAAQRARLDRAVRRDAARERDVLQRVVEGNDGPLPDADIAALYRKVISATRRLQAVDADRILGAEPPSRSSPRAKRDACGRVRRKRC